MTASLLELLNRLLADALADAPPRGGLRLREVALDAEGVRLLLSVQGLRGLPGSTVCLRLSIREVGATHTRCTLAPDEGDGHRGLGRLLSAGVGQLPRPLLRKALARLAGDAVQLDDAPGDIPGAVGIVVEHAALLRRLRG